MILSDKDTRLLLRLSQWNRLILLVNYAKHLDLFDTNLLVFLFKIVMYWCKNIDLNMCIIIKHGMAFYCFIYFIYLLYIFINFIVRT